MLKNFVSTDDLVEYYPTIEDYLPSSQNDYSTQINEAFNLVLNDVRSRSIDARFIHQPLDLKRAATATSEQDTLTSSTETTSTTGTHIDGQQGFRRFVVNVTAISGTPTIAIQGSNDVNIQDSTEPSNWTAITSVSPTATGESTAVFYSEHKYYRYVSTIASGTITYTAAIYETEFDVWTIYKTLHLIFKFLAKTPDDIWSERAKFYDSQYSSVVSGYKFALDSNEDNLIDESDELNKSAQRRLTR
jgi:hypothetical protein